MTALIVFERYPRVAPFYQHNSFEIHNLQNIAEIRSFYDRADFSILRKKSFIAFKKEVHLYRFAGNKYYASIPHIHRVFWTPLKCGSQFFNTWKKYEYMIRTLGSPKLVSNDVIQIVHLCRSFHCSMCISLQQIHLVSRTSHNVDASRTWSFIFGRFRKLFRLIAVKIGFGFWTPASNFSLTKNFISSDKPFCGCVPWLSCPPCVLNNVTFISVEWYNKYKPVGQSLILQFPPLHRYSTLLPSCEVFVNDLLKIYFPFTYISASSKATQELYNSIQMEMYR